MPVTPAQGPSPRARGIVAMFARLSRTYDRTNRVLTAGFDRRWRALAARRVSNGEGRICVDVCTGTGAMAATLRRALPPSWRVIGLDASAPMLEAATRAHRGSAITWVMGDAGSLPFRTGTVDSVTIAFAVRNLTSTRGSLLATLVETRRVLRPAGMLVLVETSQPPSRTLRWLLHLFARRVVRPLGALLSGHPGPYDYLARSIVGFLPAEELSEVVTEAGFTEVTFSRVTGGVVAIHTARV